LQNKESPVDKETRANKEDGTLTGNANLEKPMNPTVFCGTGKLEG